jgi:mono/diheme cytochrome c family protein
MKRAIKIIGLGLLILVLLLVLGLGYSIFRADRKLNRIVEVNPAPVAFVSTPEALAQGKYLFDSRGCGDCHGSLGQGHVMIDNPKGFHVRTPNITKGGVTARYVERDWVRAIRHGVKPDGRPMLMMPSEDYNQLTDADLAALVAYVRSLPAAPASPADIRLPLVMKAVYAFDLMQDAPQKIDHSLPPPRPVAVAVSIPHGEYVARTCSGCHGPGYSGGKIPATPPSWPPAANLTPGAGSAMAVYDTPEKFRAMIRSGKRPDGSAINAVMPFESLKNLTDTDLDAMHAYFKTLPAKAAGNR